MVAYRSPKPLMGVRISPPVQKDESMEKVKNYILESIEEIRSKVTWPKFSELQGSAILVLVASFIFAVIIGLIDFGFQSALDWFYREF